MDKIFDYHQIKIKIRTIPKISIVNFIAKKLAVNKAPFPPFPLK